MRTLTTDDGQTWDVAVHQASYGAHYLLFAARGSDEIRQAPMSASSQIGAEQELAEMSDEDLKSQLGRLEASDPGHPPEPWA